MHHFRSTLKKYKTHHAADKQRGGCSFCQDETMRDRTLAESATMSLVTIRTKYDIFEGRRVLDHLMIIPKRHVESLHDFSDEEKIDMMTLMGAYEAKGYNSYARGIGSVSRSVAHQHTHLIKLVEKRAKIYAHIRKPYIVFQK